jgi:lipopolysaccharide/colanic/teichoic acid biosynthesis glycosyltransferase
MKIVYVNKDPSQQEIFKGAFLKHQVEVFDNLYSAFQWMHSERIPDILATEVDATVDPTVDTMEIIRSKPHYKRTIMIGYTQHPDRNNKNQLFNEGFLDVVETGKITTSVFQIIHLFTQKHGKSSLTSLYSRRSFLAKRMLDISISSLALLLASPVLIITAIAIRLESKGPIFYRSKRVGSNYTIFDLLKFRTMVPDADKKLGNMTHLNLYSGNSEEVIEQECPDCKKLGKPCSPIMYADDKKYCENFYFYLQELEKQGIFFKAKDDPRISRIGKFLRNSSIDELPQLINILKGDMSLVGNRPLPLYEAEKLTSDIRAFRFLAPAGLTGLWQVTKRGKKDMSEDERIALDNNYALNHSILLDIKIILKTFPALLQSENV